MILKVYKYDQGYVKCVIIDPLGSGRGYSDLDFVLVYDHLAFSEYKLGNLKKAAQYTRDLLQNGSS